MTVNYEAKDKNQGTLTFEIPKETVKKGLDQAFKNIKNRIQVPGFRKGKVPRKIFNNVYGEETLYEDAFNKLLPEAYEAAIEEAGIQVVGQPKLDIESMEKGQPWIIKAEVHTKPKIKLGDYKQIAVDQQDREVSEEDVNQALEAKRQEFAELVVKESPAEQGDTVVIDFEGFVDGEAFEGGAGDNYSLELGSNTFIPGFEDQLIGAESGAEVEVQVTFPEDYQAEQLAGQEAVFKVKVHEVKAKELPELDDEFAKDADDEVEGIDELKNKLRVQLEEAKEAEAKDQEEDEALRQAVDNAEVVDGIPEVMVEEEIQRQVEFHLNNLQRQGISPEMYYKITNSSEADLRAQYAEEAELRTKTNLVLEAIIKEEGIEVAEEERQAEIDQLAGQYNMPADQVTQYVTPEMLDSDIKMKKAMNIIIDSLEYK